MSSPQAGILTHPSGRLNLVQLAFVDRTAAGSHAAVEALRGVLQHELTSDLDPPNPPEAKDQPSAETGELGFADRYDRAGLTVTVGFSSSAFDALGIAASDRPADLIPIPWQQLGDNPASAESGDICLQICSDDAYVNEHVVRRIEQELSGSLTIVAVYTGTSRYSASQTARNQPPRREARALIGFLDGTSNLHPADNAEDAELVFVDPAQVGSYPQLPSPQPGGGGPYPAQGPNFPTDLRPGPTAEPAWTAHGSYMTVRASTFDTRAWDALRRTNRSTPSAFKVSGASLDLADDPARLDDPPAFATDQASAVVALNSHVRKANPRRSDEDLLRRIFRRGFPLIQAGDGGLKRGLVFISFARTLSTQFEFIFRAWLRNPDFPSPGAGDDLLLFHDLGEQVLGGGYYFVPPLRNARQGWSWTLPAGATAAA